MTRKIRIKRIWIHGKIEKIRTSRWEREEEFVEFAYNLREVPEWQQFDLYYQILEVRK